jgi:hypothetical protein
MKRSGDRVIARDQVIVSCDPNNCRYHLPITGSPDQRITRSGKRLFKAWYIFVAALREIFDENAYERFLSRTHSRRSTASYREFLLEREAATARKPRCC